MLSVFILMSTLFAIPVFAQNPAPPGFVPQAGIFAQPVTVTLHAAPQDTIYYTLDGSEPDRNSYLYSGGIQVDTRENDTAVLSYIDRVSNGYSTWAPPRGWVQLATVIRARSVRNGVWSRTMTATYLVHPDGLNRYTIPVLSVATDSVNFFGHEDGIYVLGRDFQNWVDQDPVNRTNTSNGHAPANYYRRGIEAEVPAHFEMFEPDGRRVIAQDIGVRIHGGFSRAMRMKSLRLYARSDYGTSRFRYQVFPDQELNNYNRLLLRVSGQDLKKTMFRDAMMQGLVQHLSFETQAYRPAVMFLNGEFWGIHNLRERYDRHYFTTRHDIPDDRIDLLTGNASVKEGSNGTYIGLRNYAYNPPAGVSDEVFYQTVSERMDIQNFIEYYVSNIYFNNRDWPHGNIDFWRYQADGVFNPDAPPPYDGRWRWLMFDTDFGFAWTDTHRESTYESHVTQNLLEYVIRPNEWSTALAHGLLRNPRFRQEFVNTHMDLMNTAFQSDRVVDKINSMAGVIEPHMQEHLDRLGYFHDRWRLPRNLQEWDDTIEFMRRFAIDRPEHVNEHYREQFGFDGYADVEVAINDTTRGWVQLNSIHLRPSTPGVGDMGNPSFWSGTYFQGNPIRLEAIAQDGFEFDRWIEYPDSSEVLHLNPLENIRLTAIFSSVSVSVEDQGDGLNPAVVALHPNYPNPFNPLTTIRFELDEARTARLVVYDVTGRRVAVLSDGMHSPGAHRVQFNAADLASGMYIYRLYTENEVLSGRMMLVK